MSSGLITFLLMQLGVWGWLERNGRRRDFLSASFEHEVKRQNYSGKEGRTEKEARSGKDLRPPKRDRGASTNARAEWGGWKTEENRASQPDVEGAPSIPGGREAFGNQGENRGPSKNLD